jgi:hypothetical protein
MKTAEYPLIPMSEIRDEIRKISVSWHENATNWIGDKHKLASDIQNYANSYASQFYSEDEVRAIVEKVKRQFQKIADRDSTEDAMNADYSHLLTKNK